MNAPTTDLLAVIRRHEREDAITAGIDASLAARRAERPTGQRIYRERAARAHRARMDAAFAFKGEDQ